MTKAKASSHSAAIPQSYADLVKAFMPRPIHDKAAFDNTQEIVDRLAGHELNDDQEDYLDLLSQLLETYEDKNFKSPRKTSGIVALRFLLRENGLGGDGLADILGIDRSVAFKILKGNRNLTIEHMKKLAHRFRVDVSLFV